MADVFAFGQYAPDVSIYKVGHSRLILNVVPRGDGYGPFRSLNVATAALPAACRGAFLARKSDGTVVIFAATATKLYQLNNTDLDWDDASKAPGTYSALTSTHQWQFAQAGNLVFAVQANVPPQVFNLSSSTEFADLAGSPPQASYCAIVGRFLVLSGLLSNPFRIHWSGLNDYVEWTPGVSQSDYQDLSDGGIVRGVAGGEYGLIFQDGTIRRMIYAPGSPVIFQIERITEDKGLFAPYSIIRANEQVFACLTDGFYRIRPGGNPEPIGRERVDRTFFADVDTAALQLFLGANDPSNSRVYWAYKSTSGTVGLFDRVLAYDYVLDRWAPINLSGEYLTSLASPGITLESLDAQFPSIDDMSTSLDDFSVISLTKLAGFNSDHKMGFFSGDNLEATMETAEQTLDRRVRVKGARPITDAASCYVSIGKRETLQEPVSYSPEQAVNVRGLCPANVDTRIARAKVRIPAATNWEYATGVEPEFVGRGKK